MNAELNSILALPEVKDAMARAGVEVIGGKPEKLDTMVRSELGMWAQVVKKGNITAD
jgi:tripartite-type tricarboxylate transporter receptor subunit TctC